MTRSKWTRRDVLRTAGGAVAAPYFVPSHVLGATGRPGANDRVIVGLIGLGGRCRGVAQTCLGVPQMQIAAICDIFKPACDGFLADVGKDQNWNAYTDFNEMYDRR